MEGRESAALYIEPPNWTEYSPNHQELKGRISSGGYDGHYRADEVEEKSQNSGDGSEAPSSFHYPEGGSQREFPRSRLSRSRLSSQATFVLLLRASTLGMIVGIQRYKFFFKFGVSLFQTIWEFIPLLFLNKTKRTEQDSPSYHMPFIIEKSFHMSLITW